MFNFKSIKIQLIIFLILFSAFLSINDNQPKFVLHCLISGGFALAVETILLYFKSKTLNFKDSSFITGLIIGYILPSDLGIIKIFGANFFAILSKYFICTKNRHIFNPAAFGVFVSIVLFNVYTQWKGTYLWYIIVPFGIYFAFRIKRLEIILSYLSLSILLFGIQTALRKYPLTTIFGYFSYFYIFFMLVEPKTTPNSILGKYIFGALVSIFVFVLTEYGFRYDVELFSLLIANLAVPVLNKFKIRR